MHIGIMSMQRIINYGSYMQAYGLRKMLQELGADVDFVDYSVGMTIEQKQYYENASLRLLRLLKRRLYSYLHPQKPGATLEKFSACYPRLGLDMDRHYRTNVDTLVVGSDEVFNCLQTNPDVGYSLELFGKNNHAKKLISYAASFGDTTLARLNNCGVASEIAKYLKRFDAISVRDQNSASIVKSLTGKEPPQHLDPALVGNIEKEDWVPCKEHNFMIVYGYWHRFSEEEGKAIMDFAAKRGLKVICLCAEQTFGDAQISCRPDEILGYFEKVDYVVTDTFHGTIFSMLYHKPLAVFCRESKDVSYSNENKLLDLLKKMGLTPQRVIDLANLEKILLQEIDYEMIDRIRQQERQNTMKYLKEYCGEKE